MHDFPGRAHTHTLWGTQEPSSQSLRLGSEWFLLTFRNRFPEPDGNLLGNLGTITDRVRMQSFLAAFDACSRGH